jgi:hypothetical protein
LEIWYFFEEKYHAGVVVGIDGDRKDPEKITIVQTSHTKGRITSMKLQDWMDAGGNDIYFGHPNYH